MPGVNFGELEFYTGGFNLPEGNYCLFFDARMHVGVKQDGTPVGQERLGIMLHAYPIDEQGVAQGEEPLQKFLALGSNAHKTFCPDVNSAGEDGLCKSLALVPGGPGQQPNLMTNWALFLKSLYDSAMPKGVFTNDLKAVDGVWVHTQNVPEPEERKGFGRTTGEVEVEVRKNQTIPVVTAILDGGKPWEGSGGLKSAAKKAPGKAATAPKAGPKAVPARTAPAAKPAAPTQDEDAVRTAAVNAIGEVLGDAPNGMAKLVLRTKCFPKIKDAEGEEMAKTVADAIFSDDAALNGVLADVGYSVQGAQVKPIA